jgi:hypothetical protein
LSLSLDPGLGGPPRIQSGTTIFPPSSAALSAPIVLTGVPERGTALLFVAGLALLAAIRSRRT